MTRVVNIICYYSTLHSGNGWYSKYYSGVVCCLKLKNLFFFLVALFNIVQHHRLATKGAGDRQKRLDKRNWTRSRSRWVLSDYAPSYCFPGTRELGYSRKSTEAVHAFGRVEGWGGGTKLFGMPLFLCLLKC